MSNQTSDNNKRIAKNTLLLYVRMLFMMVIGLYTSRVILDKLGEVDFGIYNVVGGFVTMFSIISGAMTSATQRFLSFEIGKGKEGNVKGIFSTMIYIHLFLALLVLIVGEIVGVWFLNTHMNFPADRYGAANWVFQLSLLVFILNVINVPYNGALIAYEKMSAFAYFSIFDAVFKLAICYVITLTPFDKLVVYAVLMAFIQILLLLMYFAYCRLKFSECRFTGKYNKEYGKNVGSFVGWNLIGSLSGIAKEQGVNVVLNMFFGPAVNAARGIAVQVQTVCQNFCTNFQMAVNPQLTKSYAQGNLAYMHQLLVKSSKFSFFILFMITLPLMFEAKTVLTLWLGVVPEHTVNFLRLILITGILYTLSNPICTAIHATGNIKRFQIIEGTLLLLIVPIAYILLKFFHIRPEYVFLVHIVVELFTQIVRLKIVLPQIEMKLMLYIKTVVLPIGSIVLLAPVIPYFIGKYINEGLTSFFVISAACVISTSIMILSLGCTASERAYIMCILKKRIFNKK